MEALLAALLAALVAETGDRTQRLAHALSDKYARAALVLGGVALAAAANAALAALAGHLIAPLMTREAATLLLAVALVFAGVSALIPQPAPRLDDWRLGAFGTSFMAAFVLGLGDKTTFLTLAIAARTGDPVLAAAGAWAGVTIAAAVAVLGRERFKALPLRPLRLGAGSLFLLLGLWSAIVALRLV